MNDKIGPNKRAAVINADFAVPAWTRNAALAETFDIIVSGFAIRHQPDNRKRELCTEIYHLLKNGGLFLNLGQVSSATPSISEIFNGFFLDYIGRFVSNAGSDDKIKDIKKAYYQDKHENIPAPVEAQCQWLREIGFREVDCFFKTFELALFGGTKAAGKRGSAAAKNLAVEHKLS